MALKSSQPEGDKVDIEELLDYVDKTLDRVKVLYEQYFLGMQKQPPTQIHTDVERRLRELQQINIRNTGLRYRFATIQQKFGSYNSYWRRTVRQIENGTYIRNLSKISRKAAQTGEDIPEEILAAMPKRMQEQVKRDREQALAIRKRREEGTSTEGPGDFDIDLDDAAVISDSPIRAVTPKTTSGAHILSGGDDADFDIEAFFASVTDEKPTPKPAKPEVRDEDTQPNAAPVRPSIKTMPIARVAAAAAMPPRRTPIVDDEPTGVNARPRPIDDEPTGVTSRPSLVEDEPTGVVTPPTPQLPGMPIRPASVPGVTSLAGASTRPTVALGSRAITSPGTPQAQQRAGLPGMPRAAGEPPRPPPPPPRAASEPPAPPTSVPVVPNPPRVNDPHRATMAMPGLRIPTVNPAMPEGDQRPTTGIASLQGEAPPLDPRAEIRTQAVPVVPPPARPIPGAPPRVPPPIPKPGMPAIPRPATQAVPVVPMPMKGPGAASSQQSKPNPIAPGAATGRQPIPVQSMQGPFPRTPVADKPKPAPSEAPQRPPPGMNDADVNALYAKYVKAKEMVGEAAGPGAYSKLMKTINAQAPKIMEQYKAKGVEFSVVVKDNQVIIKAKPKT